MIEEFKEISDYLNKYFESRQSLFESAAKDFKATDRYGYGIDVDDRLPIYQSMRDLALGIGNDKNLLELRVPEDFVSAKKVVEAIEEYRDYLKRDLVSFEPLLDKYKDLNKEANPVKYVVDYTKEVLEVINNILTFEEVNKYLEKKEELFNVYLRASNKRRIRTALNRKEINALWNAINSKHSRIVIAGTTIELNKFEVFKVYDVRFMQNKFDRGALRSELDKRAFLLRDGGLTQSLLKQAGYDVTEEFINSKTESTSSSKIEVTSPPSERKIYISHSDEDTLIAEEIIILLEGIGVRSGQIFTSKVPGYDVGLGEDFYKRLRKELNEEVLVLFIVSSFYFQDPLCLCEMGATWISTNKHIPILIPPMDENNFKGVLPNSKKLTINDSIKLNELFNIVKDFIGLENDFNKWERNRARFLSSINNVIDKNTSVKKSNFDKVQLLKDQALFRPSLRFLDYISHLQTGLLHLSNQGEMAILNEVRISNENVTVKTSFELPYNFEENSELKIGFDSKSFVMSQTSFEVSVFYKDQINTPYILKFIVTKGLRPKFECKLLK